MPTIQTLRVVNPRRTSKKVSKRRVTAKRRSGRRNPLMGGGELLLMTNPKKKRSRRANSSTRRRRRANPFFAAKQKRYSSHRRRSNPVIRQSRRRRRNPAIAGQSPTDLLKIGASAAVGAIGTKTLTQMVLQTNNTGWMGYGANAFVAFLLAWAGGKFLGDKVGLGIGAGGIAATVIRIWQDKVSLTSPSALSGVGDLDVSGDGMGEFLQSPFALPSTSKLIQGNYIVQNPFPQPVAVAAPTGAHAASLGAPRRIERWMPR